MCLEVHSQGLEITRLKNRTTGALRNTFSYEINHKAGKITNIKFKLKDSGKYIYAKYIDERPDVITRGYWHKIELRYSTENSKEIQWSFNYIE